jgi:micrococcal nuclease|tara:strand:- start:146 stop:565 length:420 start_codon:yes stop_codon:yes gene_type:complete
MYEYKFKLDRVVDGDTIDVVIDLGFSILHKCRVRLFGIDTPESRTRDLDEKARGKLAKDFLSYCLASSDDHVIKTSVDGKGKFGRVLGEIYCDGKNINLLMIDKHHAVAYKGQSKDEIASQHLANRQILIDKEIYIPID